MFQVGQSIGDYAVLQELGKGGYGKVYKVEHTITSRREAMKILAASDASPAEQSERFLREIRLQASLSHPNIAVVHTAFWVNDDLALVCELLEGESLKQRLDRQALSQKQALDIIIQVLEALTYAHARGIIHRDISPSNIFLTSGGTVKIIDFGLAKAATDLHLTREGSPVGAAHYMSPEQIRGAQDIDARTDIYSCGVVLYELLVGKRPFEGDNTFDIMKAHTEEAPPVPAAEDPEISPALSNILLRALEKKAEARFQAADAFLQAIRNVPAQPAAAVRLPSTKRPVLVMVCVALTMLVGTLVAAVSTRLGNAQSHALVLPLPPVFDVPAVVMPSSVTAVAKTTRRHKQPRVAAAVAPENVSSALLEPASVQTATNNAAITAGTAPETKPRSGVVKVLKRMNPFQKTASASKIDAAN